MIVCEHVTFRYREAAVDSVRDLSCVLREGERVAIMGRNGSGKSTLARLMAGLLGPTSGDIHVTPPDSAPSGNGLPSVGMLFQNPDNQMVSAVVDKEVAFSLENIGLPMSEMEPMVRRTLDRFGIGHLAARLTGELSGGEKQRVALAGVMVGTPPVLVLDEPDSYLDVAGRQLLRSALEQIRQTYPYLIEIRITQFPQVARDHDRLLVMDKGRMVGDDTPSALLDNDEFARVHGLALAHVEEPIDAPDWTDSGIRADSLAFDSLRFGFESGREVLAGISGEIRAGECVALVGSSGSGKSTLGLLLCGLLKPDAGAVTVRTNGSSGPPSKLPGAVSTVLQQPERQFFLSTCREEVAFGPANMGMDIPVGRVEQLLVGVGLDPELFGERDPISLSVGEKRRLAFASILAMSPAFIVFDEPTAGLDLDGVARFIRLAQDQKRQGKGLVVITHDGFVVRELADRIWSLADDGTARETRPETFFADPTLRETITGDAVD